MLKTLQRRYYQVKEGQTLEEIADYFSVSPRLLAHENGLKEPPSVGRILWIPMESGNAYTVGEGDTPALLCGSEESFVKKNGASIFYLGMRAIL
ncbi:MAG: LysM peptidoglycan-binding domain-containing protein [Clostridia bacterium]|nr:LysM peptidoglycan-binding domain-containing protein [Clostridia bacterium]